MMTYPPEWVNKFVGIPFIDRGRSFEGADCYGLCYLVYKHHFGIEIPKHGDEYTSVQDWRTLMKLVHRYEQEDFWVPIDKPVEGAVAKLRVQGRPVHLGLMVAKNWMLHTEEMVSSTIERTDNLFWGIPGKILGYAVHKNMGAVNAA